MSDHTLKRNPWAGPADAFGAAVAAAGATSLRTRLIALGLVAALLATSLVVWGTPSLRTTLAQPVSDAVQALGAPPAAAATQDRADEQQAARRAKTRSTLTELAAALTAADRETASQLARTVLETALDDPMLDEMLAGISLTRDQLWQIASVGSARPFEELLVEAGYTEGGPGGSAARSAGGQSADGGNGPGADGSSGGSGASGDVGGAGAPGSGGSGTVGPAGADSTEHQQPVGRSGAKDPEEPRCWHYTWQQDAQAVYLQDLEDPYGLDGNPGPRDDDGIACRDLPDDPDRAPSQPQGQFVPTAPSADELLSPSQQYFGMFTEESPYFFGEVDEVAATLQHMPSSVTYFAGWDQDFRADAATSAWTRNMLPIVSWEARPNETNMGPDSSNAVNEEYQLADIIAGNHDDYLRRYAADVAEFGLPVGIRMMHEMNGHWYPWSEQTNGNKPGEYVAAWRHVHDIFTDAGAENVLWFWSPNTIEFPQAQPLEELYPGDEYVDVVGLSGYYRKVIEGKEASFENTYGRSVAGLRAVAPGKPIFLTEVGATETGGKKAEWVTSFFEALRQNPDIIGFTWFQREVTAIPIGESEPVTNDWRLTSSPEVTLVAQHGLRNGNFSEGAPEQPKTELPPLPSEGAEPTEEPTEAPEPTEEPTEAPTDEPAAGTAEEPSPGATEDPTAEITGEPAPEGSGATAEATAEPAPEPSPAASEEPTGQAPESSDSGGGTSEGPADSPQTAASATEEPAVAPRELATAGSTP
ncbi:glycoside hydrolase family 26 protein [Georgenia daeguensis]|uniref:GH26 domain-containing protein n=1 Tax=Georgenia daeguensis TaxID=908355 RepID=A0ABP8EVW9_9MICO